MVTKKTAFGLLLLGSNGSSGDIRLELPRYGRLRCLKKSVAATTVAPSIAR